MTRDEITAAMKAAHAAHVAGFGTRFHSAGPLKVVLIADQTKEPVYAEAVILDTEKGKLSSVAFSHPLGRDTEANWKEMLSVVEAWHENPEADWDQKAEKGETRAQGVVPAPAGAIIRRLGLFKTTPDIGEESYEIFKMALQQAHGDDADAILDQINRERFVEIENARMQRSLSGFSGHLKISAAALDALVAIEDFTWRELEFYGRLDTPDDKRGSLRRQAAKTYPLLARYFANNSGFSRQVIERKQPLKAALANRFDIKEKSLDPLHQTTWPTHGLRDGELLKALSDIPPDWFPKTAEDWQSFCILAKTIGREIGPLLEGSCDNPLDILFKGAKGKWREFHERCAMGFLDTRPPQGLDPAISSTLSRRVDFKALGKAKNASEGELAAKIEAEMARFTIQDPKVRKAALAWLERCTDACTDTPPPAGLNDETVQAAMRRLDVMGLWKAKSTSEEDFVAKIEKDLGAIEVKDPDLRAAMNEWMAQRATAFFETNPPKDLSKEISFPMMAGADYGRLAAARSNSKEEFDAELQAQLGRFAIELEDMQVATRDWMRRRVTPDLSEGNMQLAVNSTRDMVKFVRDHIVIPAASLAADNLGNMEKFVIRAHQRTKCGEVAARLLLLPDPDKPAVGKAAPNVLETTRAFLNGMGEISKKIFDDSLNFELQDVPPGHWPRLFDGQVETPARGFYFEALTCEAELREEAKALSHCVDGYGQNCRRGGHILGFRKWVDRPDALGNIHRGFEHVGTMEIVAPQRRGSQLRARQFFGHNNGYFSPATRRLQDWLLMQLNTGQIKVNWDTIEAYKSGREDAVPNEVHRICGYDWTKEADITRAVEAVKPILHKAITKEATNASELIAHDVMLPAIGAIDMIYGAQLKSQAPAPAA